MSMLSRCYKSAVTLLLLLLPAVIAGYIGLIVRPTDRFAPVLAHIFIVFVVSLVGIVFAWAAYASYRRSKDAYLRDLVIGFIGFAFLFAPHGIFGGNTHEDPALFDLFGAFSRLVLAVYMLIAALRIGRAAMPPKGPFWKALLPHLAGFIALDFVLHGLNDSLPSLLLPLTVGAEALASLLFLAALVILPFRRKLTVLLKYYSVSLALFCQCCAIFVWAYLSGGAWMHLWWAAHVVFATAFLLLGYAVSVAYERTGSFVDVFSEADLLGQITEKADELEAANLDLQASNKEQTRLSEELRVALKERDAALKTAEERAKGYEEVNRHLIGREQRIIELKEQLEKLRGAGA